MIKDEEEQMQKERDAFMELALLEGSKYKRTDIVSGGDVPCGSFQDFMKRMRTHMSAIPAEQRKSAEIYFHGDDDDCITYDISYRRQPNPDDVKEYIQLKAEHEHYRRAEYKKYKEEFEDTFGRKR